MNRNVSTECLERIPSREVNIKHALVRIILLACIFINCKGEAHERRIFENISVHTKGIELPLCVKMSNHYLLKAQNWADQACTHMETRARTAPRRRLFELNTQISCMVGFLCLKKVLTSHWSILIAIRGAKCSRIFRWGERGVEYPIQLRA